MASKTVKLEISACLKVFNEAVLRMNLEIRNVQAFRNNTSDFESHFRIRAGWATLKKFIVSDRRPFLVEVMTVTRVDSRDDANQANQACCHYQVDDHLEILIRVSVRKCVDILLEGRGMVNAR